MLKLSTDGKNDGKNQQPPSGGCVLKLILKSRKRKEEQAATFGWLCVETSADLNHYKSAQAAAFARLCVET